MNKYKKPRNALKVVHGTCNLRRYFEVKRSKVKVKVYNDYSGQKAFASLVAWLHAVKSMNQSLIIMFAHRVSGVGLQ